MKTTRSELVLEIASSIKKTDGFISQSKKCAHKIIQTNTSIFSEIASKNFGKDIGEYVSFSYDDLLFFDAEAKEYLSKKITQEIKNLIGIKSLSKIKKILIVGLGNDKYACDSLGKHVADRIIVTKPYLAQNLFSQNEMKEVYVLTPGVFGTTGMESLEIIKSVCGFLNPNLVIVIDSMVASKTEALTKSIQLSNTKLSPGGGVGNNRKEISKKTLGVDILAIGVPMVVNLSNICVCDENLIVSPKDVEQKTFVLSKIIAKAINKTFCSISEKEYNDLTN